MIEQGQYFTINRARQYGKTTTLRTLARFLEDDYVVISLDFQMLTCADFENEPAFVRAFSREILDRMEGSADNGQGIFEQLAEFSKIALTIAALQNCLLC